MLTVDALSLTGVSGQPLVDGVSFTIAAGETLGVVGESGSGKSLSAFAIAGLLPEGVRQTSGTITLGGTDLGALSPAQRRAIAGQRIGMVFQDPMSSFNPVRTVGSLLVESALRHQGGGAAQARAKAIAALADVKLPEPERAFGAYPHQLSGGQRQRAMIALALLNSPALLIADEPTTALDATVQLAVLALLKRASHGRALLMITHDLAVAASLCDRLVVMQQGRIVETGATQDVLKAPQHPYTQLLLEAVA
jgi:ABC-type glutathione transport system ATPase component